MTGPEPRVGERAADQQAAVAVERLALGAKQAHAIDARMASTTRLEAGAKLRRRRHALVVGDAVAIKRRIARTAAERVAEREIGYAFAGIRRSASALAENQGTPARERHRADIGDGGDTGFRSSATKRSAGRLEWPMVRRSQARGVIGCPAPVAALAVVNIPAFQRMSGKRALALWW